jgi:hypothetical protein
MTNQPLYSTNAHGDIWQEPTLFDQPNDADIEMAQLEAAGNRIWALKQAGICTHTSANGFGPVRCTSGCGTVWATDEEWLDAMSDAIS